MKNWAWHGAMALAVAGSLALAPGGHAESVIRTVPQLDVKFLDPYQNSNYGTRNHGHMIYETLFAWDAKQQPKPDMVGDYSVSSDKMTYRFTLRPGLKWHDGKPVTTADVIASLDKWMKKDALGQKLAGAMGSLKADDDKTFTLTLKQPFGLVLDALAKPSNYPPFILPERFAKLADGAPEFEPIGSGPFIFQKDQWQPGNRNVYLRNPDYVPRNEPPDGFAGGKVVKVDRVEWLTMPDVNTAANALIAGEVDRIENVSYDVVAQLENNPDITVQPTDAQGTQHYLRPNQAHPPFDNLKARQALLYAIDHDEYGRAVTGDKRFYVDCWAYVMCGSTYGSDAGAIKPDLAKAKTLLQEAGYKGEPIQMPEPTNTPQFDAGALITASQLKKAGFNIELMPMDYNIMISRRAKKDGWNLYVSGNQAVDVASPMTNVYLASNCEEAAPGWPCDKMLEDLKDAFARAETDEERKAIAEKIQLRAIETVPYVPVGQLRTLTAHRNSLKGVLVSPIALYWNVEKRG